MLRVRRVRLEQRRRRRKGKQRNRQKPLNAKQVDKVLEKNIQSFRFFLKFIQGFVTCLLALAFRSAAVVCKTL